jgi:hypothetical protein
MNSPPDPRIRDRAIPERPPRPRNDAKLEFTRKKRVAWFSPGVLARAGQRVLVSSAFGDFLDKRELQAATPVEVMSHRADRDEAWIDYVADTGDGFDATYSTAWLTAQRVLEVDGVDRALPRGSLLVLGGDEVYPSGDSVEYDNRFKGPYKASLPYVSADQPALLAIPGNHDWYDGLTNFLRVFCQEKWIGGRRTLQSRSYFAVRLPQSWWLWGIDIQFDAYIDEPQLRFFESVVQQMGEGARLILCTAKPSWVDVRGDPEAFRNLGYLESRIIRPAGIRLLVSVSGDSHHYAHYAGDGTHKVTAGGGGAFLHPTHHLDDPLDVPIDPTRRDVQRYHLRRTYPHPRTSRWLSLGALGLPLRNPTFLLVPALLYLLLAWSSQFSIRVLEPPPAVGRVAEKLGWADLTLNLVSNPMSMLVLLAVVGLLIGFAKPSADWSRGRRKWLIKAVMGLLHTAAQVSVGVSMGLLAIRAASAFEDLPFYLLFVLLFTALGALAGALVMGAYLAVSCAFFRAHGNEAFSSIALTSHKNFLRLHIDAGGALTIYPIGIDRVVHRWKLDPDNSDPEAPWLAPDNAELRPRLIEEPIRIDPGPAAQRC